MLASTCLYSLYAELLLGRGRIAILRRCGLLLQTEQRGLSVGLFVTIVIPAKTAEPIETSGRRNHVLDGGPAPRMRRAVLKGNGWPVPVIK